MVTTTPLTPAALAALLRSAGVAVVEHAGWADNARPGDWGPMAGTIVHHTVVATTEASVRACFSGNAALAGPLCHGVIDKSGTVHLVGGGRANHAGSGSGTVLAAVRTGADVPAKPGPDTLGGNAHFYGWELVNRGDGADPWPEAQVTATAKVVAALCRHHGWNANHVIGHKEWTSRKVDPRGIDMDAFRSSVTKLLAAPAAPPKAATPAGPKYPGHYLREGTSDRANTKVWQRRLNSVRNARLVVDGVFGPKTEAATVAFQRAKKISADGIVGPVTWKAAWN